MVRALNLTTQTRYEALQQKKKEFAKLQSVLAGLNESEQRALIHLVKNKRSSDDDQLLDSLVDEEPLRQLAELSEQSNYELKNRYRHDKRTMQYANKRRMKVDERTVREMLRNQHHVRQRLNVEVPNYSNITEGS